MFKINTCILYLSLSVLFLNFISQTCFIKYKNILILKDRYFLAMFVPWAAWKLKPISVHGASHLLLHVNGGHVYHWCSILPRSRKVLAESLADITARTGFWTIYCSDYSRSGLVHWFYSLCTLTQTPLECSTPALLLARTHWKVYTLSHRLLPRCKTQSAI